MNDKNAFVYRKKYIREGILVQEDTRVVSCIASVWVPADCFARWERYKELTSSFYSNGLLGITRTISEDGNVYFKLDEDSLIKLWDNQQKGLPLVDVHIEYKPLYVREDEAAAWVYDRMKEIFEWLKE